MNTNNLGIDGLRSLSRVFSAPIIKKILFQCEFNNIDYRINRHMNITYERSYSAVIKSIYNKLILGYRNEYIYKNEILSREFIKKYSETSNAVVLDELRIDSSIADVTILNGEIKVFEIKTELDSFNKLSKQINDYTKFADKIYIVIGFRDRIKTLDLYKDSSFGIIYLSQLGKLKEIKKATKINKHDHETIFKVLKREEYSNIIYDYFGVRLDVPNTLIFKKSLSMIKNIDILVFQKMALSQMKNRIKIDKKFLYSDSVPHEFKYLYTQLNLKKDQNELLERFLTKGLII